MRRLVRGCAGAPPEINVCRPRLADAAPFTDAHSSQTIGLDFFEKRVTIRGDLSLNLQVWDIGGQSIASAMLAKYIYGAQVVFLCYDVTDRQSFDDVSDWLALVRRVFVDPVASAGAAVVRPSPPKLYLVGNKVDLEHLRKVTEQTHDAFVRSAQLEGGFTMSAQSGENVLRVFYQVAAGIAGVKLSAYELAFTDKCLAATVVDDADLDEGRTDYADEIEAEDLAAEAAKRKRMEQSCGCWVM